MQRQMKMMIRQMNHMQSQNKDLQTKLEQQRQLGGKRRQGDMNVDSQKPAAQGQSSGQRQLVYLVQLVQLVHLLDRSPAGSRRRPATVGWEAWSRLLRHIRRRMSAAGIASASAASRTSFQRTLLD